MPFRVRRRSHRDGSRWASLPRCSGGCMALAAFPLGLLSFREAPSGLFRTGPSCAREREFSSPIARDGPHELVCLLWPRPSGFGHAACWRFAVSRERSHTACAGAPPRRVHSSLAGPCSRTPPRRSGIPCADGESCACRAHARSGCRAAEAALPAGPASCRSPCNRRADGLGGLRALLRAPIGWIGKLPRSPPGIPRISHELRPAAAEPPPCRVASSPRHTARSLGALPMSPARVHSRRVASPSAGRCHPTRRVPPSWFDPHLDGFLRAPTPRLLHLVPA